MRSRNDGEKRVALARRPGTPWHDQFVVVFFLKAQMEN